MKRSRKEDGAWKERAVRGMSLRIPLEECRKVLEKMIADSGLEKRAVRGISLRLPMEELCKVLESVIGQCERLCAESGPAFTASCEDRHTPMVQSSHALAPEVV